MAPLQNLNFKYCTFKHAAQTSVRSLAVPPLTCDSDVEAAWGTLSREVGERELGGGRCCDALFLQGDKGV